jgi:hypothetical protein
MSKSKRARIGRPPKYYRQVKLMLPPTTDDALERIANALEATKSEIADDGIKAAIKARRRRGRPKRKADDNTVLVYFDIEAEKLQRLEALARQRGCTIDELVSEAIEKSFGGQSQKEKALP